MLGKWACFFSDCHFGATDCFIVPQKKELRVGDRDSSKNMQNCGLHMEHLLN